MTVFVDVAVDVPRVDATFTYHLPPELEERVAVGQLVVVPFGERTVPGVVVDRGEASTVTHTRAVEALLDPEPVVTPQQIALARHMARTTLSPLAAWLRLMLPPGLSGLSDTLYRLTPQGEALTVAESDLTPAQRRLVRLLQQRGMLRGRQIDRALPRTRWRSSAQALRRRGLLRTEPILRPPAVRAQTERWVELVPGAPLDAVVDRLGRPGTAARARREAMLRLLREAGNGLPARHLYRETGGSLADLRRLEALSLLRLSERPVWRDPLADFTFIPSQPPPLTEAQRAAWEVIAQALGRAAAGQAPRPILLHGVTGSGKTEIYLRAIAHVLDQGKQAIFLVPEIALTPQTIQRVLSRFPGRVGLMHSRLSTGERYDTWRRARDGEIDVIVGPRSALFAPLPRLGLIVIDECHEDAYAQQDAPPIYHAREVAVAYARLWPAVCLMGSATPDVTSTHRVERGDWRGIHLPDRILAHREAVARQIAQTRTTGGRYRPLEGEAQAADLPPIQVVDMRAELRAGNRSIFSRALQRALGEVLVRGEQAILFLNRRGTATYVFCRDCGHALQCPRCDLPLTYHRPDERLTCHHCGYERRLPNICPACGSERIRQYGTGTERVEAEVQRFFPQARTLRWDRETTRRKGAHARILAQFAAGEANVLIGTQMLAKGLDLPRVTLVGVVLAEVGLNLPDYRAGERVFQVLTQVAGRAGRSPLGGQVVLQTFQPDHYVIQAAARHDYAAFYQREIRERARLGYPPFAQLARLLFQETDEERARQRAFQMAEKIRTWAQGEGHTLTLIGPAPCFFARRGGIYRWHLILRGPDVVSLLRGKPLEDILVEVNPVSLL